MPVAAPPLLTRRDAALLAAWTALVVAGALLGHALYADDPLVRIGNAPLVGAADLRVSWRLAGAVALAAAAVAAAPALAARLPRPALLAAAWATAGAWAVALAAGDGWAALTAPLRTRYEYLAAVDRIRSPHGFVAAISDPAAHLPTHVKGHPPGFVLLLGGLDRVGLGGATVAAVLVIAVGALMAPAAITVVWALADEAAARTAAPFLALAPAAVWVATSADAFFAGVAACGIALVTLAAVSVPGPRRAALAFAGGLVLGGALHLSYGIAPLGLVVGAILVSRRAVAVGAVAAGGVLVVVLAFVAGGFFWLDGLDATRSLYYAGVATRRPYASFLVIDLAAFAIALGPAAFAGLARLRDRRLWWVVGAALAAIAVADLSGLSRGETERIWLPFVPWVLVATAALAPARRWLALQLLLGLTVQAGARSPW